jgi:1-acyl-sn-glycerol-3-phosphate acyltransferase
MKQLHDWGLPWLFDIDPVVFPVYLGLPWGLALGPLPHLPLPLKMRTYVGEPILFERYGTDAANDRIYVQACYDQVVKTMQAQLDALVAAAPKSPGF